MTTIRTASELLEMMRLGCYTIGVIDGFIEVSPAFSIDDEMADLIKTHKIGLINILKSEVLNDYETSDR